MLDAMVKKGMNITKVNCSEISRECIAKMIEHVRTAATKYSEEMGVRIPVAVALETRGPNSFTGTLRHVSFSP